MDGLEAEVNGSGNCPSGQDSVVQLKDRVFLSNGNQRLFIGEEAEAFYATIPSYDAFSALERERGS